MDPIKANPNPAADPAANKGQPTPSGANATPKPEEKGKTGEQDPKMVPLTALHEAREETKQVKEQLSRLAALVGGNNDPGVANVNPAFNTGFSPQPANPTVQSNARELDQLWEENPRAAMQTEMGMMLHWYDGVQAELDRQEEEVAGKYTDYPQYRTKIKQYIRMVKPEQRRNPGTVETAYYLAKGQNTDAVRQSAIDDVIKRIQAGEQIQGISGTTSGTQTPTPVLKPTDDQAKAAEAMGMSVEDYLKHLKR